MRAVGRLFSNRRKLSTRPGARKDGSDAGVSDGGDIVCNLDSPRYRLVECGKINAFWGFVLIPGTARRILALAAAFRRGHGR